MSLANAFKAMIVSQSYIEDRANHEDKSHVTSEISGTGYTAGGKAVTVSQSVNNTTNELTIQIQSVQWASSTLSGRKLIVYRSAGTQYLLCCIDNGATDRTSNNSTLIWPGCTWTIPLPNPIT